MQLGVREDRLLGGVTMWTAKLMHMFIHEYAEQNLAKKKLTRRIFIGGGLGALVIVGSGAGWAYNRYLAEHTEIEDTTAYEAAAARQMQAPPAQPPQTPPN